jgi:hypothetical protein
VRTVTATRYVTPLREGGSLPAIVEADDLGLYVVKFRGAGQGSKALVAELIAGELARAAGLNVPEIVLIEISPVLGRAEPDDEIRDLLNASVGLNLALDYLPGSITFDPLVGPPPSPELASLLVVFDAFVLNVDRTPKNPNLLLWHKALRPIDHGASLYFHHAWPNAGSAPTSLFPAIRDHVLLPFASALEAAQAQLARTITPEFIAATVASIPESWLVAEENFSPDQQRDAYRAILTARLSASDGFVKEAARARALLV